MTQEQAVADREAEDLHRMEMVISRVLQAGVVLSFVLVLAGVIWWACRGHTGYEHLVHRAHDYPTTLGGLWRGLRAGRPLALVQTGLVVLIFTPVVRVAAAVLVFLRDRDWVFAVLTLIVLALLLFGILSGKEAG
jgi:uncharacterized membrane protein